MATHTSPLPHSDALSLLELARDAIACSTEPEFHGLIDRLRRVLPFDCAVAAWADIGSAMEKGAAATGLVDVGYPPEYVDVYSRNGYQSRDLVLRDFLVTGEPQNFVTVERRHPGGRRNVVRRLDRDHGLLDGWAYGVVNADGEFSSVFFFAGRQTDRSARAAAVLEHAVPHLTEALKRVLRGRAAVLRYGLTPCEVEVLKWVKDGKSSWEISVILGKSERCVNFHVANAVRKLNAANRTHAVAIAVAKGIVEL